MTARRLTSPTRISLAAYRPQPNVGHQLLELFEVEFETLRAGGHVTERRIPICRTDRGEYLVILEWAHDGAVDEAHQDDDVLAVWARKAELAEYIARCDLADSNVPFISYQLVRDG